MSEPAMVSIITVNYNQTELTCALLDSIRAQDYRAVEVIVVDNASATDPTALFQTRYPEVTFIRSETNLGFAGGNNLALPGATGDYLFFVNNDAELSEGCIKRLVDLLESTPGAGVVSPLICYTADGGRLTVDGFRPSAEGLRPAVSGLRPEGIRPMAVGVVDGGSAEYLEETLIATAVPPTNDQAQSLEAAGRPPSAIGRKPSTVSRPPSAVIQYAGMPRVNPFSGRSNMDGNGETNRGQYAKPFNTGYAHGAAMMVPRKVLKTVGPMREDYFLYYEEVDWCEHMIKAGYSVWVEPRALVWHKESMSMQTLGAAKTFYLTRNRIRFMRTHYGGWPFVVFTFSLLFLSTPVHLLRYLLKADWSNTGAFLRGLSAGLLKP